MNRVQSRVIRARITTSRAAPGSARLSRRISHAITTIATTLESVQQAEPVPNLVGGSLAQAVLARIAGHGAGNDGAAVNLEVLIAVGGVGGEVAVAQILADGLRVVEVEVLVSTLAQGGLHVVLVGLGVVGPIGVDSAVGGLEDEGDAAGGVVVVENLDLVGNGSVADVAVGDAPGGRYDVDVDVDDNVGLGEDGVGDGFHLGHGFVGVEELQAGLGGAAVEVVEAVGDADGEGGGGHEAGDDEGLHDGSGQE